MEDDRKKGMQASMRNLKKFVEKNRGGEEEKKKQEDDDAINVRNINIIKTKLNQEVKIEKEKLVKEEEKLDMEMDGLKKTKEQLEGELKLIEEERIMNKKREEDLEKQRIEIERLRAELKMQNQNYVPPPRPSSAPDVMQSKFIYETEGKKICIFPNCVNFQSLTKTTRLYDGYCATHRNYEKTRIAKENATLNNANIISQNEMAKEIVRCQKENAKVMARAARTTAQLMNESIAMNQIQATCVETIFHLNNMGIQNGAYEIKKLNYQPNNNLIQSYQSVANNNNQSRVFLQLPFIQPIVIPLVQDENDEKEKEEDFHTAPQSPVENENQNENQN